MITGGIILLLLGWILGIGLLWNIGALLVVVGAILWIVGTTGRTIGPSAALLVGRLSSCRRTVARGGRPAVERHHGDVAEVVG